MLGEQGMEQLYKSFEDLLQSHVALFKPYQGTSAINVFRGVWEARQPDVDHLTKKIQAQEVKLADQHIELEKLVQTKSVLDEQLKKTQKKLNKTQRDLEAEKQNATELTVKLQKNQRQFENQQSNLSSEISELKEKLQVAQDTIEQLTNKQKEINDKNEWMNRELKRLQQYETTLDSVQKSQFVAIESLTKRLENENSLRTLAEQALRDLQTQNEKTQLEIITKDDLIARQQARIEDLESRAKQQQRLNARMGHELDKFARENEQLSRALNQ
jgi:chromosome segregation protein